MEAMISLKQYQTDLQETKLPGEVLTFLIAEFIAIKVRPDSKNTRNAYLEDLRKFGDFTMGDLSDRKLLAYKLKVIDQDKNGASRAARTANRMLSVTRRFIRFLQEKRVVAHNYYDLIDGQRVDKSDSPYVALTDAQVRLMMDTPDRNTALGASQRLALVLGFYVGLRCNEICDLRFQDVSDGVLTVRGKGRKVRRIGMPETLINEFNSYLMFIATTMGTPDPKRHLIQSRESDGHKIAPSTIWRWYKSISTACGVDHEALRSVGKKVSTHSARATAITKALDSGVGIRDVANLAGHASIETTAIYDKRRNETKSETVAAIRY